MNDFLSQTQSDELVDYRPTAEDRSDYADYADYLDSIGYDEGDDDWDEDPDAHYGFRTLTPIVFFRRFCYVRRV